MCACLRKISKAIHSYFGRIVIICHNVENYEDLNKHINSIVYFMAQLVIFPSHAQVIKPL